jgi:hypothetical protein
VPLDPTCKTLNNACASDTECCSQLCIGGVCANTPLCTQNGDVCATAAECCGGVCNKLPCAALGTCAPIMQGICQANDGALCFLPEPDGGLPACGGFCCSRLCAPYGAMGIVLCQPPTGCHMVGEVCTKDGDCCGSAGLPGQPAQPVVCLIMPGDAIGVCRNPIGCKPDGDVCKLPGTACNASCDCCSGNCENVDTCNPDSVGVGRCHGLQCAGPGEACASSASCCNGRPCVPNPVPGGTPPLVCYPSACVPACGTCTVDADCCPGETCSAALGSAHGQCGPCPDGGTDAGPIGDAGTCSLYGQLCAVSSDCCNGVPCNGPTGPCAPDAGASCTCHYPPQ